MQKERRVLSPKELSDRWRELHGDKLPTTVEDCLQNPELMKQLSADLRRNNLNPDQIFATIPLDVNEGDE